MNNGGERFKMPVSVHLLIEKDGKLLMLRRANTGYEDGKWSLPAGHIDLGEPASDALIREAREELGITIIKFSFVHVLHKRNIGYDEEYIDLFFRCTEWDGDIINIEKNKCSALEWHSAAKLPLDTIAYIKHAINEISEGKKFSEFGWA